MLLGDAQRAQRLWRCPRSAQSSPGPLPPECSDAIERVERVIGGEVDPCACPGLHAWEPDVGRIADLYSWWLRSQLAMVCPYPNGAVTDAITTLHGAIEAAKADAMRRLREEHEREKERR